VDTKILLVDDETRILQTFARTLRLGGYTVITAASGQEGLALYHQEQPDIVLLDLRMPGMDGLEVLQAIREDDLEANVILCTAHGDKEAVIEALRAGASDFLPKPIDQVTLESALRRAEERMRLKRKLRASQEALRRHNERLEEEVKARTADLREEIEERKRTEEALRESEARYRRLLDTLQEGVWAIDADNRTTYVNPRMTEMLGYSEEEMLGKGLFDFMDEQGVALAERLLERRRQGLEEQHEFQFLRKDGQRIYTLLESAPILDQTGQYCGAIAGVIDITERKQIGQDLRIKEAALDASLNAVAMADLEARLTYVNDAFLEWWGYDDRDKVLGRPAVSFWQTEDAAAEVVVALRETGFWQGDLIARRKDGTLFDIQLSANVVTNDRGQPICMMASFVDITDRKRAEKALRESEHKLRSIIKGSPSGIVLCDEEGIIIEWNPAQERISGIPAEKALGQTMWQMAFQMAPEEYRTSQAYERTEVAMREMLNTGRVIWPQQIQKQVFERPDGTCYVVETEVFSIKTEQGFMLCSII
jgi:PAS domain S-box-containing protein